jgi:hypothetical protein
MHNYTRVIPRDFFNESNLLFALGRFQLYVHNVNDEGFVIEYNNEPFDIQLSEAGYLYVSNYNVYLEEEIFELYTIYNSKQRTLLMGDYKGKTYQMLDKEGNFLFKEQGKTKKMKYKYLTNCVSCGDGDAINEMSDNALPITLRTIQKHCIDFKEVTEKLGYGKDFAISNDYHVRYYKSKFKGKKCYFFTWSCIEYIFTEMED